MSIEFTNILCDRCGKPLRVQRPITEKEKTCTDCKKEISDLNKEFWEHNSSEISHRAHHSNW